MAADESGCLLPGVNHAPDVGTKQAWRHDRRARAGPIGQLACNVKHVRTSEEMTVQISRIDPNNAKGLVDKVIGLGKEIVGSLTNSERLEKAGQVQQAEATERIKARKAEVRADVHEAKASAAERAQRSAQKTKEAVNG